MGRWNDPGAHLELMAALEAEYDGWALSASAPSLGQLLPGAPAGARVAVWVKPFAAYKANVRVAYTWEPVIYRAPLERRADDPVTHDHLAEPIRLRAGLVGAKPARFVRWMLGLLAWQPGDEVTDLFPGTGTVETVLDQGRLL